MDWSWRRQRFNHDWLKNQYLTSLTHLVSIGQGQVEDPVFVQHFVDRILPQWLGRKKEVLELAATFENQMSPRTLFCSEPLASNAGMQQPWVADLIEALWRVRTQPEQKLAALQSVVRGCDDAWEALRQATASPFEGNLDAEVPKQMYKAFAELAQVLSEFPTVVSIL
jgi:hypothetical protein